MVAGPPSSSHHFPYLGRRGSGGGGGPSHNNTQHSHSNGHNHNSISQSISSHISNTNNSNEQHGIRDVWAYNLEAEMATICRLIDRYPYVAMDTEFPGVVGKPAVGLGYHGFGGGQNNNGIQNSNNNSSNVNNVEIGAGGGFLSRADYAYQSMRINVNMLKLIQLGLTLMDEEGRTPPGGISTWQFNFHFSLAADMYQESSIRLLTKAGITFSRHEAEGVDPRYFAALLTASGLVLREEVTWLSFHSGYDFGYLLRMLTGAPELPPTMTAFFDLLRIYFPRLYDLKYLVGVVNKRCTVYTMECGQIVDIPNMSVVKGGLSEIAKQLNIPRKGPSHQAGSDSLLTGETFFKVRRLFFDNDLEAVAKYEEEVNGAVPFLGTIYGLKVVMAGAGEGGDGLHDGSSGLRFTTTSKTKTASAKQTIKTSSSSSYSSSSSTKENDDKNRIDVGDGGGSVLSATPSPPLEEDEEEEVEDVEEVVEDEVEEVVEDEVEELLHDVMKVVDEKKAIEEKEEEKKDDLPKTTATTEEDAKEVLEEAKSD